MSKNNKTLEAHLTSLMDQTQEERVSLSDIIRTLSRKGRPILIFFLVLPFCQPIVPPGLSVPFGLVIAFLGIRMSSKHPVWLPKWLLEKKMTTKTLRKILAFFLRLLSKTRHLIRPRLFWACRPQATRICNGILICILGLLLAFPFPLPLINLVSAWPIFLIALGTLEDDGLFVLLGYAASLFALAFYSSLVFSLGSLSCTFFHTQPCP